MLECKEICVPVPVDQIGHNIANRNRIFPTIIYWVV